MLSTKVKALKLLLKLKCYITEKSRAVAIVTTFAFTKEQNIPTFFLYKHTMHIIIIPLSLEKLVKK
jgi:hypothetical protein